MLNKVTKFKLIRRITLSKQPKKKSLSGNIENLQKCYQIKYVFFRQEDFVVFFLLYILIHISSVSM